MPEKLFVGGLPFDFRDDQLKSLFDKVGTVLSAEMVQDPAKKRTRGFGFVTVSGKEEALAAIKQLSGTKVGEKSIYITEARERPPRKGAPPARPPRPKGPFKYPHPTLEERKHPSQDPRRARFPRRERGGPPRGPRHAPGGPRHAQKRRPS